MLQQQAEEGAAATTSSTAVVGWIAALISCLAFGSFAVPIKSDTAQKCKIDPLVFQTYKTAVCFVTSVFIPTTTTTTSSSSSNSNIDTGQLLWYQLYSLRENFTLWGIVSALFWVPGGVAAIYAVQNAGLALSQGVWSSVIVLVAFSWGILVFDEPVRSKLDATLAVIVMVAGLCGMSYFSSATATQSTAADDTTRTRTNETSFIMETGLTTPTSRAPANTKFNLKKKQNKGRISNRETVGSIETTESNGSLASLSSFGDPALPLIPEKEAKARRTMQRKQLRVGLAAAVFNGIWGGSVMVPMKFAPPHARGPGFVFSFAVGASLVTASLWLLRFCYNYWNNGGLEMASGTTSKQQMGTLIPGHRLEASCRALPSLHFSQMWKPGGLSGLVWSLGNLAGMVAVQELGVAVGHTLAQASMLVSGLWGILYFDEIKSTKAKVQWLLSALVTVTGIALLSYQHQS